MEDVRLSAIDRKSSCQGKILFMFHILRSMFTFRKSLFSFDTGTCGENSTTGGDLPGISRPDGLTLRPSVISSPTFVFRINEINDNREQRKGSDFSLIKNG